MTKIISIIIFGLLLTNFVFSEDQIKASDFKLSSGDHKTITLSELKTKLILCFYETKDTSDKNKDLKKELQDYYNGMDNSYQKTIFVLAVADCSQAFWPFTSIWEGALIDRTKQIGFTLYGDWNGKMREDYHFIKDEANFAIIDTKGIVRYKISGKVKPDEIINIKNIIIALLKESE
jgi:peroxiredoxin